jgi:hypothetical protein
LIWGAHYRIYRVVVPEKCKDSIGGSSCVIFPKQTSCSNSLVGKAVAFQPKVHGFKSHSKF